MVNENDNLINDVFSIYLFFHTVFSTAYVCYQGVALRFP